jgi:predicted GH43/DUF377 family glycosyl hydrolase
MKTKHFPLFIGLLTLAFGSHLQAQVDPNELRDYYELDDVSPDEHEEETGEVGDLSSFPDLEKTAQDFILETKRIRIPGYPDAFNPSLTRWRGQILLSFRIYHPFNRSTNQIGLCWLDENLDITGEPTILEFFQNDFHSLMKRQDPRLITFGDRLFVVYNNQLKDIPRPEVRRMLYAEVQFDGEHFYVEKSEILLHFDGENAMRPEKNWVPFDYQGSLLLGYSQIPHRILRPLPGTNTCETMDSTFASIKWNWGVPRGGTPALIEGGEYLAFFHSSKNMASVHSKGKTILHYFMGAYTFSLNPPFQITRISPEPIVGKDFYHGASYKTWKPVQVVFPGGFIQDGQYIWIAYGRQDHEVWVVKLDRQRLLDSLVPVKTISE